MNLHPYAMHWLLRMPYSAASLYRGIQSDNILPDCKNHRRIRPAAGVVFDFYSRGIVRNLESDSSLCLSASRDISREIIVAEKCPAAASPVGITAEIVHTDLPVLILQIFKFKCECPVRASFCRMHVFIVPVICFTGEIEDPLQIRCCSISRLESTCCAACIYLRLISRILFPFIRKAHFSCLELVRLVFHLNLSGIFGDGEIQISDGATTGRQRGGQLFYTTEICRSSEPIRKTLEGKLGNRTFICVTGIFKSIF